MAGVSYYAVGSNDLPRAKAFYDTLLASIGFKPFVEHPSGGRLYGARGKGIFAVPGPP